MSSPFTTSKAGFTIIEVMLVLAITGLMLVGVLVGSNAQISTQRYHDSVTSLQSQLQEEYSQVTNVTNNRSEGSCPLSSALDTSRGADSTCLIIGRLVTSSSDGTDITSQPVIGKSNDITQPITSPSWTLYALTGSADSDSYTLKWGSSLEVRNGTAPNYTYNTPSQFSMLIVASPQSGALSTYVDPTGNSITPSALLAKNSQSSLTLCVKGSDGIFSNSLLAVQVAAAASGTNAVQIPSQSNNDCQGA